MWNPGILHNTDEEEDVSGGEAVGNVSDEKLLGI